MPVDETIRLKTEAQDRPDSQDNFLFFSPPVYNIDDCDSAAYMIDHQMEGVFILISKTAIDPEHPGQVYADGQLSGTAIIHKNPLMPGSIAGLPVRRRLREYGRTYTIRYEGARTSDGADLAAYEFSLPTLPKLLPGEKYPEHDRLVLEAARESMVLLRNENNALPLGMGAVVNAFGKGAATFRLGCVGAGKINPRYGIRFEEGIRSYSTLRLNDGLFDYYRTNECNDFPDDNLVSHARAQSGTAVVVLTRGTGESQDNRPVPGDYYLTDSEKLLLEKVSGTFDKTVVVLNAGYPIEMSWVQTYAIDAVLWCGLPGMAGGIALAEILEGRVSPSGRLPDTWALDYFDHPSSRNFYAPVHQEIPLNSGETSFVNTVYEEGLYVGYRYFETFHKECAFPFGHGLSYTSFDIQCVRSHIYDRGAAFDIRVTNTGAMAAKNTVLIFVKLSGTRLEQPARRLAAFAKTNTLAPGASETLHLDIGPGQLKSYDTDMTSWIIEPGTIRFYMGGSVSEAFAFADMEIPELVVLEKTCHRLTPPLDITELSQSKPEETWPTGKLSGFVSTDTLPYSRERSHVPEKRWFSGAANQAVDADQPATAAAVTIHAALTDGTTDGTTDATADATTAQSIDATTAKSIDATAPNAASLITFPMLAANPNLLDAFVMQLNDYELCRMSVGARTGWSPEDNGFAGTLFTGGALKKYQLPDYYMADGNNGLNLNIATIGFPVSNSMGATFNEALVYAEGRALATEAIDMNLQCILAPAMNLHRNPLCGRHAEYFSEDPYLSGRMGGMESKGIESMGISSVMKHLFANNAENYRNRNHSLMTERTARELYLYVFETAMQVHMPDAVMTGYNPANGCWCAGDEDLLEGILREEWHFPGYVMTDWGSSACCSAADSVQAGNSWIAPGEMDDSEVLPMLEALAEGRLDKERLRQNVKDMYGIICKYRPDSSGSGTVISTL